MYPPVMSSPPSTPPGFTVSPTARLGTALARLAVAACAFFGVYEVAYHPAVGWTNLWFLSQSGSLVTAIMYTLFAVSIIVPGAIRLEGLIAWFRGALAAMMLLICIGSIFVLGSGNLDDTGFLFEHLITPLVVTIDYLFIGRAQLRARGWQPLTWVGLPLTYLALANLAGETHRLYGGMLDPSSPRFLLYVPVFLAITVVFGYLLFGGVKLRAIVHRSGNSAPPAAEGMQASGHPYFPHPQHPQHPQHPGTHRPTNMPPPR